MPFAYPLFTEMFWAMYTFVYLICDRVQMKLFAIRCTIDIGC